MNQNEMVNLVENVIVNEFYHIDSTQGNRMIAMKEYKQLEAESLSAYEALLEAVPEEVKKEVKKLLNKYSDTQTQLATLEGKYYFQKGVVAGVGNLRFLEDTKIMPLL